MSPGGQLTQSQTELDDPGSHLKACESAEVAAFSVSDVTASSCEPGLLPEIDRTPLLSHQLQMPAIFPLEDMSPSDNVGVPPVDRFRTGRR